MARCKPIDTSPRFIAVDLERQLHPGTFEHALNYLVDRELDLTLRGQKTVDTQWKLFCLVHNIEKLAHHGVAQQGEGVAKSRLAEPQGSLTEKSVLVTRRLETSGNESDKWRDGNRAIRRGLCDSKEGFSTTSTSWVRGGARLYRAASPAPQGSAPCQP